MNVLRKKSVEQTLAETEESGHSLKRDLTWWDLAIMGVAVAVGAGIFSIGAQAAVNHRELQPLLTYLQDNLHLDAPLVRQIGCVIGTHTGPGAFGIAFFDKELTLE